MTNLRALNIQEGKSDEKRRSKEAVLQIKKAQDFKVTKKYELGTAYREYEKLKS